VLPCSRFSRSASPPRACPRRSLLFSPRVPKLNWVPAIGLANSNGFPRMPHLPHALPAELGLNDRRLQSAYDRLDEWTSCKTPPIPGGTILVGRHGKTLEPRFFGRQGPEPDSPALRREGIFLLASITKPDVYMGAMMLVERG